MKPLDWKPPKTDTSEDTDISAIEKYRLQLHPNWRVASEVHYADGSVVITLRRKERK